MNSSLENKERVYSAMISSHRTLAELRKELQMESPDVELALRYLSDLGLIRRRREDCNRKGVVYSYIAQDSSDALTFEEKVSFAKSSAPWTVGRCDFAAAWIPRQGVK